jgi:hypothetical protein
VTFGTNNEYLLPPVAKLAFQPGDLTPLAAMALDEFLISVNKDTPLKDVKSFIDAAKEEPQTLKMGGSQSKNTSPGRSSHASSRAPSRSAPPKSAPERRLLQLRVRGRRQDAVRDTSDERTVLLGLCALRYPFGIALEGVPHALALGEVLPFEEIVEGLVALADQHGPEPDLADAVLLPELQRDRLETPVEVRQATGRAMIDAKFVEHASPLARSSAETAARA